MTSAISLNRRSRRAFVYVEIALTAVLIAILAAIAVPNFLEAQTRAAVSRARSDLNQLKLAIENYRLEHRAYPPNRIPGQPSPNDLAVLTTPIVYLGQLPIDIMTLPDRRKDLPPESAQPYHYDNALQVDPRQGLVTENNALGGGFIAAVIWGWGPTFPSLYAHEMDYNATPYTTINPGGYSRLLPYEPTNGTLSSGDIYQRLP